MLVSRIHNLLRASFRGVAFSVRNEVTTDAGRKVVLHEYPNSSDRYVEDLGQIPPKFRVAAFVHGADFLSRASSLEQALNKPGSGRLILPTLGSVLVSALPYRKDASQQSVGIISFELEFAAGRPANAPTEALSTVESVFSAGDSARTAVGDALEDLWEIPATTINKKTARFDVQSMAQDLLSGFSVVLDSAADITRNASRYVLSAGSIASATTQLFTDLSESQALGGGYAAAVSLLDWGNGLPLVLADATGSQPVTDDDIPLWSATTAGRISRNTNRLNIVDTTRANALVIAYEQAASTAHTTADEIQGVREQLEAGYGKLINTDGTDHTRVIGRPGVRQSIDALRFAALDVLNYAQVNAYQLQDLTDAGGTPITPLAYKLYMEGMTRPDDLGAAITTLKRLNPTAPTVDVGSSFTVVKGAL